MMRRARFRRRRGDATLTLINIVFLLLAFFMVAGRMTPPVPEGLTLVSLRDRPPVAPDDTLAVTADGRLFWMGRQADVAAYVTGLSRGPDGVPPVARVMPDRDLPAARLVAIAADLRAAGAQRVMLVANGSAP